MRLHEVRNRIVLAQANLKEISPCIECYMAVSINGFQFMPGDLMPANSGLMGLVKYPKSFVPGQDVEKLTDLTDKINQLSNTRPDKFENQMLTRRFVADFASAIETFEFHEPQFELRFYALDMARIQELKAHPVVQRIGKTDMSPAEHQRCDRMIKSTGRI